MRRLWDLTDEGLAVAIIESMAEVGLVIAKFGRQDNHKTATVRLHELVHNFANSEAERHEETAMWDNKLDDIQRSADPKIIEAALRDGGTRLDTVRLMVLGGPSRGKTSTLASLRGELFEKDRESTQGVDLCISHLIPGDRSKRQNHPADVPESDTFRAQFRAYLRSENVRTASEDVEDAEDAVRGIPTTAMSESEVKASPPPPAIETFASESVIEMAGSVIRTGTEVARGTEEGVPNSIKLRCWDFGGQREYEVAHELFISPRSIFMLVFNLQDFEDLKTRDSEIKELRHWLQTICALIPEKDISDMAKSVVLVGTRSSAVQDERREQCLWDIQDMLLREVSEKAAKALNLACLKIILLENEIAVLHPEESGLLELEQHLQLTAKNLIQSSPDVPLRWLAFLEALKKEEADWRLYLRGEDMKSRMKGYFFPRCSDRERELEAFLLYFRNLGELVLLASARGHMQNDVLKCNVFLYPEKVLAALKRVIAPARDRCKGLSTSDHRALIEEGVISMDILKLKWGKISCLSKSVERQALVELFTSLDLFVDLGSGQFGVPALLKSGWKDWGWLSGVENRKEISAVTTFENYVPSGLIGTLVGRLHRIFGQGHAGKISIDYVRSNAVLLTLGLESPGSDCQVFVGFDKGDRELHWIVRGNRYDFMVLGRCLQEFETYKVERFNTAICSHQHFFVSNCPRGCGKMGYRMDFSIPSLSLKLNEGLQEPWWEVEGLSVWEVSENCPRAKCNNKNCMNIFSYGQTMGATEPSAVPRALKKRRTNPNPFVVFVSHAGADDDKGWAEYMKKEFEKNNGPKTFVDRQSLTGSCESADDLMNWGLEEARVGVFILSPQFFARKWTMHELRTFLERRKGGKRVVIFPVFHRLSYEDASNKKLNEEKKFRDVFLKEGLLKIEHADKSEEEEKAQEKKVQELIGNMSLLCRNTGLEKKLKELHEKAIKRDPERYEERREEMEKAPKDDPDKDLGGVSLEHFFDVAVEKTLAAYQKLLKEDLADAAR